MVSFLLPASFRLKMLLDVNVNCLLLALTLPRSRSVRVLGVEGGRDRGGDCGRTAGLELHLGHGKSR